MTHGLRNLLLCIVMIPGYCTPKNTNKKSNQPIAKSSQGSKKKVVTTFQKSKLQIMDVQGFDLEAIRSLSTNPNHLEIGADFYASPFNAGCAVNLKRFSRRAEMFDASRTDRET